MDTASLLNRFEAPKHDHRVYVLGCFARHLTLYSQQVRAFNLVKGLCDAGRLQAGTQVAVIGSGASGLTAAAAAAVRGAKVTVFEQLDGPMEYQLNNRQRWLHPYIYDWPDMGEGGSDAKLPLLNWQANYAERVAYQIKESWDSLRVHPVLKSQILPPKNGIEKLALTCTADHLHLNWGDDSGPFDLAIIAVGFGLEPHRQNEGMWSYWSEDDIDGDFRRAETRPKWLVSGTGDGALTDIMRLCLRRFRHADILSLVEGVAGIAPLKLQLKELHQITDEQKLHNAFLAIKNPELQEKLAGQLRPNGPRVTMVGESVYMFGPKASILNRLIVSQLYHLKAFHYFPGRTEKATWDSKKEKFTVKVSGMKEELYERVLLRHGAEEKALQAGFPNVWAACEEAGLRIQWEKTPHHLDETRKPLFSEDEFPVPAAVPVAGLPVKEPVLSSIELSEDEFGRLARRLQIYARSMTVSKQIRSDGSSTLACRIEGLTLLHERRVKGLRIRLRSAHGVYGTPVFDQDALRLSIEWRGDRGLNRVQPASVTADALNQLSGVLTFESNLRPFEPVSFGFSVDMLNGDAVSAWQFEQMYDEDARTHMNGEPLPDATEYLARVVWFPVETLTIRLTLPTRITKSPSLSVFRTSHAKAIRAGDVIQGSLLLSSPPPDSSISPRYGNWMRDQGPRENVSVTRDALQSWELVARRPAVGSCYSLDWELPRAEPVGSLAELALSAREIREQLLDYGHERRLNRNPHPAIREIFQRFADLTEGEFPPSARKQFEVSLMTYSDAQRKLFFFEGTIDGQDLPPLTWEFSLPFGVGLAGACFKEADRAFLYEKPNTLGDEPSGYLPVPDGVQHEFLLSLPIYEPGFYKIPEEERNALEPSRFCIAVVNIGSAGELKEKDSLSSPENYNRLLALWRRSQSFGDALCETLGRPGGS